MIPDDNIESEIDAAIDDVYERFLFHIEAKYDIDIWVKYEWDYTYKDDE